jgi:hypothetical protein
LEEAARKVVPAAERELIDPAHLTKRQRVNARKQRDRIFQSVSTLVTVEVFNKHLGAVVDVSQVVAVTDRETRQQWVTEARNARTELTRMIQWLEQLASHDDMLTHEQLETVADHRREIDISDREARDARLEANAEQREAFQASVLGLSIEEYRLNRPGQPVRVVPS